MTLSPNDFNFLSQIIKENSGIVLKEDKIYLLEARLLPLIKKMGMSGFEELVNKMKKNNDEKTVRTITDAMTTNETYFFRDSKPFEYIKNVILPHAVQHSRSDKIRILSIGCSSGQEVYSISMVIAEEKKNFKGKKFEVTGLDLSEQTIEKAKKGIYTQFEIQRGLPVTLMVKYFDRQGESWKVKDEIKSITKFQQYNVTEDISKFGVFDIVLCRNIMIYFDLDTKTKLLENISKILHDDSVLMVGASETIYGITERFKPLMNGSEVIRGAYNYNRVSE